MRGTLRRHFDFRGELGRDPRSQAPPGKCHDGPHASPWSALPSFPPPPTKPKSEWRAILACLEQGSTSPPRTHRDSTLSLTLDFPKGRTTPGWPRRRGPPWLPPPGKVHHWPPEAHLLPPPREPKSRRRVLLTCPEQGNISPPRTHEGGAKSGLWFSEVRHPGEGRAERAPPPRTVPLWPRKVDVQSLLPQSPLNCFCHEVAAPHSVPIFSSPGGLQQGADGAVSPGKVRHLPRSR